MTCDGILVRTRRVHAVGGHTAEISIRADKLRLAYLSRGRLYTTCGCTLELPAVRARNLRRLIARGVGYEWIGK